MSAKFPIISITGSSGAGTTTVEQTFKKIFDREKVTASFIEGDAFHRFDRQGIEGAQQHHGHRDDQQDVVQQQESFPAEKFKVHAGTDRGCAESVDEQRTAHHQHQENQNEQTPGGIHGEGVHGCEYP